MARITLPGEQRGTYSIAGLFFVDGSTEVDELSAKQAYLLGVLMGADLPDDVHVHDVAPAEQDLPTPEPEPQAPARSSADDLSAYAAGVSLTEVAADPQDAPQADVAAPETDDQVNLAPTVPDVTEAPEAPAEDVTPEAATDEASIEDVPPAPEPIEADAPAPVIGEAEDGSTTTESAIEPDPVADAAATDTVDPGTVSGGTAPAGADVTGSTDTAATGA